MKEAGSNMVHVPYQGIRQKLGKVVVEIVKEPAMRQRSRTVGFAPAGQDANTFAACHATALARGKNFTSEIGMSK
jgi:hypothetical protein